MNAPLLLQASPRSLVGFDIVMIALYFLAVFAIGFYFSRKERTSAGYFLARTISGAPQTLPPGLPGTSTLDASRSHPSPQLRPLSKCFHRWRFARYVFFRSDKILAKSSFPKSFCHAGFLTNHG